MTQRSMFAPSVTPTAQAFAAFSMRANPGLAAVAVVVLPADGADPIVATRHVGHCTCQEAALAAVELAVSTARPRQAVVWTTHAPAVRDRDDAIVRHVPASVGSRWIERAKLAAQARLAGEEAA